MTSQPVAGPRHRRRLRGDDGAVIVEFALFGPFLVLVAMGLLEYGMVLKEDNSLHTATRAAARVGSNTFAGGGNSPEADFNTLSSLAAGLGNIDSDITRVVVYEATGSTGDVPVACSTHDPVNGLYGHPGSNCNVYTGDFLAALPATFAGWNTLWDNGWNPGSRDVDENSADHIGVWVELDHPYITGIFGTSIAISERVAFRLEPDID